RHCSAKPRFRNNEGGPAAALAFRSAARRELLVDQARTGRADHFVLRAGTAGTADGADDLAAVDQRNAAARGDDVIERQQVVEAELLHRILEGLCWAAISRRD